MRQLLTRYIYKRDNKKNLERIFLIILQKKRKRKEKFNLNFKAMRFKRKFRKFGKARRSFKRKGKRLKRYNVSRGGIRL